MMICDEQISESNVLVMMRLICIKMHYKDIDTPSSMSDSSAKARQSIYISKSAS
jgi:hypothetical protein